MNHNVETITLANWKEIRLILKYFFELYFDVAYYLYVMIFLINK